MLIYSRALFTIYHMKEGVTMTVEKKSRYTEAQAKAAKKYLKESVEDIRIRVPKGDKAKVQEHAASMGESTNAFVVRAIKETMERDGSAPAAPQSLPAKKDAPKPQPRTPGLPSFLTPDVLEHIDAKRFLSSDLSYQLQIGDIIGMENLSALSAYLKEHAPVQNNDE